MPKLYDELQKIFTQRYNQKDQALLWAKAYRIVFPDKNGSENKLQWNTRFYNSELLYKGKDLPNFSDVRLQLADQMSEEGASSFYYNDLIENISRASYCIALVVGVVAFITTSVLSLGIAAGFFVLGYILAKINFHIPAFDSRTFPEEKKSPEESKSSHYSQLKYIFSHPDNDKTAEELLWQDACTFFYQDLEKEYWVKCQQGAGSDTLFYLMERDPASMRTDKSLDDFKRFISTKIQAEHRFIRQCNLVKNIASGILGVLSIAAGVTAIISSPFMIPAIIFAASFLILSSLIYCCGCLFTVRNLRFTPEDSNKYSQTQAPKGSATCWFGIFTRNEETKGPPPSEQMVDGATPSAPS